jgi:nicotinamide-nucleotide amidase
LTSIVAILTVGDELMLGDHVDTNGPWISGELLLHGIETIERRSVHDNVETISVAIKDLAKKCDALFVTGGLGPTEDDRTREAFAKAMGNKLVLNKQAHASMLAWFDQRDSVMPPANDVQGMVPETAEWIQNLHGTAPGMKANVGECIVKK